MAGDLAFELMLTAKGDMSKELQRLQAELLAVKKQMDNLGGAARKSTNDVSSAYSRMKQDIAGLGLGAVMLDFAKSSVKLAGDLQLAEVAFTTMLGSATDAKKMLEELTTFATQTPFEVTGIRDTAKQLLAFGIESNNVIPSLKMLGDLSAGLSVPIQQIAYAFGQVKVAGRLTGQELMQFTNAGVPLIAELAKNLGVAQSKIKEMVEKGQIGFTDVAKAMQSMTSEGGRFADMMKKAGGTYPQVASNFKDEVGKLKTTLGTTLLPMLTSFVKEATKVIGKVGERAKKNPELAKTLTVVAVAVGAIVASIALLGGPITAAIASIGALTAAFIFLKEELKKTNSVWGAGLRDMGNAVVAMVTNSLGPLGVLLNTLLKVRAVMGQVQPGAISAGRSISPGRRQQSVSSSNGAVDLMSQKFDFTGIEDATKEIKGGGGGKSKAQEAAEKLKEAIEKSNADFVELISKRAEQLGSSAIKAAERIKSGFASQSENVKKLIQDLMDLEGRYTEFGASAQKSLYDVRNSLAEVNKSSSDNLGKRYVDLKSQLDTATNITGEMHQSIQKEMQLIRDTVGMDAINQAFDTSKLSESQKIIQDRQSKQAELTEKQSLLEIQKNAKLGQDIAVRFEEQMGILKAYYTTKDGIEKEVQSQTNVTLAQEISEKQAAYTSDLNNLKDSLNKAHDTQVAYLNQVQDVYAQFSQYMDIETRRSTDSMISQYEKLLSLINVVRAKGGISGISSQSLYSAPTPSSNSVNSGGVVVNISGVNINNGTDEKEFYRKVQEAVVAGRRNADNGIL